MKNLFLLFCLILFSFQPTFSQFERGPGLQKQLDNLVSTLDLNQVPSGLLLDKAHTLLNFSAYDGAMLSDSNWTIRPIFDQLYLGLQAASTSKTSPLPVFTTFENNFYNNSSEAPIKISLLHFDYHHFKPNALDDNLIYHQDDHFYDTPDRDQSPYQEKQVFALGLSSNEIERLSLRFELGTAHSFTNRASDYSTLEIDFDDGRGWNSYPNTGYVAVDYAEEGLKRIKIRYLDASGQYWYTQSLLQVKLPAFRSLRNTFDPTPDDSIQIAGAEIFIFYNEHCGDHKLRKPLIISEGFDPNGEITYKNFYDLINQFYDLPTNQRLRDDFHDAGYDIIFVNYIDGDTSLSTNVPHLIAVIEEINRMKHASGSYEPNVLIGASMGGVIGKWALRKMEKDHFADPETRLFVSFDAALSGANIPVGFQALIQSLGEHYIGPIQLRDLGANNDLKTGWESLNSPAARNMLFYHIANPNGLREWHDEFYDEFNSLGDFTNIEHIAIANGSLIGLGQLLSAGECVLNDHISGADLLQTVIGNEWVAILTAAGLNAALASHLSFELKMWALPGNSNREVYKGTFIQFVLGVPQINIDNYRVPPGLLPLDSAPGGMRAFTNVDSGKPGFDFDWKHLSHCFIPAFSAMGLADGQMNTDLCAEGSVIGGGASPTESYTGTVSATFRWLDVDTDDPRNPLQHNQSHISLNRRQATFLLYHLVGDAELAPLSALDGRTYNFGEGASLFSTCDGSVSNDPYAPRATSHRIEQDLDISGNSQLWLNRQGRIGFIDEVNNTENETGTHFPVYIRKNCGQSTRLTVHNGGILHLGESSNTTTLTIEEENMLWIDGGGQLLMEGGTKIIVQTGATLIIGEDAKLWAGEDTEIHVQPGGLLRIARGSTINLATESSMVYVEGRINWKGTFDFPGYGYFKFSPDHKLLLQADFELDGRGKGYKFIELEKNTQLQIGSRNLALRNGAVSYGSESSISIADGGEALLWNTAFSGGGTGLIAVGADKVTVRDCDFERLEAGIRAEQMSGSQQSINLLLSNFTSCTQALITYRCQELSAINCNFIGGSNSLNGLYAESVHQIDFAETSLSGFREPQANGVQLIDVAGFNMSGGAISDCTYGIYCPDFSWEGLSSANIFLSGQATIEDNDYGIYLAKGFPGHGLVSMNCARLIDNDVAGISGTDIDLLIDACQHANSSDCTGNIRPNHFEGGHGSAIGPGLYFDICYEDKLVTEIPAKGNYWAWGGNPHGLKYRLGNNGGTYCSGVRLDDSNRLYEAPSNCDGIDNPDLPGDVEVGPQLTSNPDQWLPTETHADRQQGDESTAWEAMMVFPNPSTTQFQLLLPEGLFEVRIHDLNGRVIWTNSVAYAASVEVSNWGTGLYFIQATDTSSGQLFHHKLIVE